MSMKKIFIISAAAFICIALAACSGGDDTDTLPADGTALTSETAVSEAPLQEDTDTSRDGASEITTMDTEENTEAENSTETESTDDFYDNGFDSNAEEISMEDDIGEADADESIAADGTLSFGSFEDIDTAALAGAGDMISVKDSNTYDLFKRLGAADKLYIDAESADGSSMASFAVSGGNVYAYSFDGAAAREGIAIIRDSRIYIISPAEEMGIYLPYDEAAAAVYNIKTVLGMNGTDFENADGEITAGKVVAGGSEYGFECGSESGVLYDKNNKPCVLIFPNYNSEGTSSIVWVINELSFDKVPNGIFDLPSGCNITSLEDMYVPAEE